MKKIKQKFINMAAPVLVWIFPVFFLYTENIKEMQILEIMMPVCVFVICCFVFILVGKIIYKNWEIGGIFSLLNGILLGNFTLLLLLIHKIFPIVKQWQLLLLIFFITIVLSKVISSKEELAKEILFVSIIVTVSLMAFNLTMNIPIIIKKIEMSLQNNDTNLLNQNTVKGKRNIYYFLCDEYASFSQLEKDFNYDNLDFKIKLQDLKFNISEDSQNDSCKTEVVMANIMQLNYVANDDTVSMELERLTKDGLVQKVLKENGYNLRGIGDTDWLGITGTIQAINGAVTADGRNVMQLAFDKSFLSIFIKRNYSSEALKIINTFKQAKQMEIIPDSSVFTMFYVCAPHHPYYLKRDGSMNSEEKYFNYDGKNNDSYIGELEYINTNLYPILERIIENDPNAIIILCSDHGNRFGSVSTGMPTRILNTLYYGGDVINEFNGMSGINTLRYIFNIEFDMSLPYLDLPNEN